MVGFVFFCFEGMYACACVFVYVYIHIHMYKFVYVRLLKQLFVLLEPPISLPQLLPKYLRVYG